MIPYVDVISLALTVSAAVWSVMNRSLVRAAIALALTSALVAVLMFRLDAPLAGVFELSVCSGLISVLFISTISLTRHETVEEKAEHQRTRVRRFGYLPAIIALAAVGLSMVTVCLNVRPPLNETGVDARSVIWGDRPLDMIGQVVILLSGVFGVVILFKEADKQ